ncbi:class I SAM-dependent methyltransferase [Haloarchaeobius amylolyticus]|uniref:class I SAM-dependent methyltransferase n=1 Tax=Haloarchaeobius amylolyticus TaxID=1198296 RepID=UPI002270D856|nr:class I SAM-dependent methyltransferase [Haloarchaeobius amylolyticus]
MDGDPLGAAMLDYQRGGLRGECRYVDGPETADGHIQANYFRDMRDMDEAWEQALLALGEPVLDVGCGSGQYALWLQGHGRDVVPFDVSPGAVEAARDRGVEDAHVADMFDMPYPESAFPGLLANGTQLGLGGSIPGIRDLLCEFARVTTSDATAWVDEYDPAKLDDTGEMFGYRPDPREGVAHRTFHFEYDRDGERLVGETLHFLLVAPDRLRDACVGTPWSVTDVDEGEVYYKAKLEK